MRLLPTQLVDRRFVQASLIVWLTIYAGVLAVFVWREHPDAVSLTFVALFLLLPAAALLTVIVFAIPLRIVLNLALRDRRRSHLRETLVLASVLMLVVAHHLEVSRERNRLAPPAGVTQLTEFAKLMPPPRSLSLVQQDGNEYVVWFGEVSGPIDLPSGPSCYVFDQQGALVEWQAETGDGGPVHRFLDRSSTFEKIGLDEALKRTENAK